MAGGRTRGRARPAAVPLLAGVAAALLLTLLPGALTADRSSPPGSAVEPATAPLDLGPVAGGPRRPNIVVIMADDMRADELRFMPHTRRLLGRGGVRFANSFSPHPLCCPARASFVSGQYTHNHGVWSNKEDYGFGALDDSRTFATALADAGYHTVFLGKYLNGYGPQPAPDGSADHSVFYEPPGWSDWRSSVDAPQDGSFPPLGGTYRYFDTSLVRNGELQRNRGVYQTRLLGRETVDVIGQYARSPDPFFLWASYVAPHIGGPVEDDDPVEVLRPDGEVSRVQTPARPRSVRGMFDDDVLEPPGILGEDDVTDKPFYLRDLAPATSAEVAAMTELSRQRAETLHVLDLEVQRTVAALDAAGVLDDTLVVFTADNGYFLGEHRVRQGKILPYEPSLRVPTLMRGPGIPAGEVRRDPVLTLDFGPTFLDAAGAAPDPAMDGTSVLGTARDGDRGWTRGVFTETGPLRIYTGPVDRGALLDRPEGPSLLRFTQGLRTPRYLYLEHASRERELYDLRRDPGQLTSIDDRPSSRALVRVLARELDRMRSCSGEDCLLPLPRRLRRE